MLAWCLAVVLAVVLAVLATPGTAVADEPGTGLLRLAHLSPDSPAVDVSISPAGRPGEVLTDPGPTRAADLRYGDVGSYAELPAGAYAVSVRAAGTPVSTPPVLSTRVEVTSGSATTLALAGPFADLSLQSSADDLSAPPPGSARVRVVAAAATEPLLDAAVSEGPALAAGLPFPGVGRYATVPGGDQRLSAAGADVPLSLASGSVVTVLVLDRPGGGVELRAVVDAAGPAAVPVGGVEAGGGPAGRLSRALAPALAVPGRAASTVAAQGATPVRLRIPAAGAGGPVVPVGLDPAGALAAPDDPSVAGWLRDGPRPGGLGPAVLTGHVDRAGTPGLLAGLAELVPGDVVLVERADGTTARFAVTAVDRYAKATFPASVYAPTPGAELRLITCGGPFDRAAGSYRDNVVVSARLVT